MWQILVSDVLALVINGHLPDHWTRLGGEGFYILGRLDRYSEPPNSAGIGSYPRQTVLRSTPLINFRSTNFCGIAGTILMVDKVQFILTVDKDYSFKPPWDGRKWRQRDKLSQVSLSMDLICLVRLDKEGWRRGRVRKRSFAKLILNLKLKVARVSIWVGPAVGPIVSWCPLYTCVFVRIIWPWSSRWYDNVRNRPISFISSRGGLASSYSHSRTVLELWRRSTLNQEVAVNIDYQRRRVWNDREGDILICIGGIDV